MPALAILWSLLGSRFGSVCLAFAFGIIVGWWKTDNWWKAYEAARTAQLEAQYQKEIAREAQNAAEIAKAATARTEADTAELEGLRKQIAEFDRSESNVLPNPSTASSPIVVKQTSCVIDSHFYDVARRLRFTPKTTRGAKVTRPTK